MKNKLQILTLLLMGAILSTSASFANSSVSEPKQFSGILASHNQVRAKHQQVPLTWSNSLATYAQQWVNNLATTQNCSMIHRPNNNGGKFQQIHGENLFWASAIETANSDDGYDSHNTSQKVSASHVVKAWAEEEGYYNYQTNKCQSGEDCGHYTQMVWHESRQVGCALAVCPDQSQIWACNYYPRGNYIGEWPY